MLTATKPPVVATVEKKPPPKKKPQPPKRSRKKEIDELLLKGTKLTKANKFSEAVTAFKQVLKYEPRNCIALKNIGSTYARAGKRERAAKHYKRFLDVCPKDMAAPQVRKILNAFEDWKRQNR